MQARKRMFAVKQGKAIIARERLLRTKLPRVKVSYARMEAQVKAELADAEKKYSAFGKEWPFAFFNSFKVYLPGVDMARSHNRKDYIKRRNEALVIAEKMGLTRKIERLHPDRIAKEKKWIEDEMTHEQVVYMDKKLLEMYRVALPVYIELRRRGYSRKLLAK